MTAAALDRSPKAALAEAIAIAEEHIARAQRTRGFDCPTLRELVQSVGRDMRPACNARGHAVAVAIIAAEWLALGELVAQ